MNLKFFQEIKDNDDGGLWQLIKTNTQQVYYVFFDKNQHMDNTDVDVWSKSSPTKHFTVTQDTFWKVKYWKSKALVNFLKFDQKNINHQKSKNIIQSVFLINLHFL